MLRRIRVIGGLVWALWGCTEGGLATAPQPNIVILLADDLGWAGVGYHGSPIRTPHIDRLAREGVELDRFYTSPVCVPTRAGLLTGRYPIRFGMDTLSMRDWHGEGLPPGERTLADRLGEAGYAHRMLVGKWHLGREGPGHHPLDRGFTGFYGFLGGHVDYLTHRRLPHRGGELDWHRGRELVQEPGYTTDLFGAEAVRFIRSVPEGEPFFLYLSFNAPHMPETALPSDLQLYLDMSLPTTAAVYAGVITAMDRQIGAVLAALAERGVERDTLVWFLSDNGGKVRHRNRPFRGEKGGTGEGAIRVPAVVRWPAGFDGGRVDPSLMAYVDVVPTSLAAAGQLPSGPPLDGIDLLPILRGEAPAPERNVFADLRTVVGPRWKLSDGELYDLTTDPRERNDVSAQHPRVLARMERALEGFLELRQGS